MAPQLLGIPKPTKTYTPGYYWVMTDRLDIAMLSKQGGWRYFDGRHTKMIATRPRIVICKIPTPDAMKYYNPLMDVQWEKPVAK